MYVLLVQSEHVLKKTQKIIQKLKTNQKKNGILQLESVQLMNKAP